VSRSVRAGQWNTLGVVQFEYSDRDIEWNLDGIASRRWSCGAV